MRRFPSTVGPDHVAGVPDETIRKILVDNPRRFPAFVPKAA